MIFDFLQTSKHVDAGMNKMIPVRNYYHSHYGDDKVCIIIPRSQNYSFFKLSNAHSPANSFDYSVKLDAFRSSVWLAIDGENNIADIINTLTQKYNGDDTANKVLHCIKRLHKKKFIALEKPNP